METETWLSGPYNSAGKVPAWYMVVCKLEKAGIFKTSSKISAVKLDND